MPPLRAMLFDLWGTLIAIDETSDGGDRRDALRVRMAADALTSLGFDYKPHVIQAAFEVADAEHGRIHADGRDLSAEGRTFLYVRHLDPHLGDRLDDAGWQQLHEAVLTPALTVRPKIVRGAREVLAEAKSLGLPVALVSNAGITPGFVLRQILDDMGLLGHFDAAIFSDELGTAKPSAAIFERALEELDVPAADAAFLGDHPVLDVLGAQNAGLVPLQIGDLSEDGIEPHARITALSDLIPTLRRLGLLEG